MIETRIIPENAPRGNARERRGSRAGEVAGGPAGFYLLTLSEDPLSHAIAEIPQPPASSRTAARPAAGPGARPLAVEGAFQSYGQGLAEAYLGAYALLLGAGGFSLGLVATLPTAATAAAQALARRIRTGAGGALALLSWTWSAQAIGYASLALCGLLAAPWSVAVLAIVAFLTWGCGGLSVPAWTSLVSRVVPRPQHGWFFGLRGASQQAGVLTAILSGGLLLAWVGRRVGETLAFALLFLAAGLARAAGTALLARVPEPSRAGPARAEPERSRAAPPISGVRTTRKFRRLALYLWALHLATHVSTPFFVPYMLRDLGFSYGLVGLLLAVPAAVKISTLRLWGRLADRVGPGPMLRTSCWLVSVVPALWWISDSAWWIALAQLYSGLTWGAFELAQASSILQATRGREREVALLNVVDGGMLIAGSLIGGATVNLVAGAGGSGYLAAMLLSAVLRLVPSVGLFLQVRGIGRPAWSHLAIPLRVWSIRPTRGITFRPYGALPSAARAGDGRSRRAAESRPADTTPSRPATPASR
jgi:MFS family permease